MRIFFLISTLSLAANVALGQRLRLPQASPSAQAQLDSLRSEIEQNKISDAVARYDILRRLHAGDLVKIQDNELISLATCLDDLDDAGTLVGEYQKRFDEDAHRMLQSVSLDADSQPANFYAVARRYWLSSAAAPALVSGADRAAALGDWPTAQAMYQRAKQTGWTPDAAHDRRIDELTAALKPTGWSGGIPFDATWYGRADASAATKFFPFSCGGAVYVPGASGLIAFRSTGDPLWAYPPTFIMNQSGGQGGQGQPLRRYEPVGIAIDPSASRTTVAVLAAGQSSRVVIVRSARTDVPGHVVQAIRASDGKLIWQTSADMDMLADPVVSGRFVYAMGIAATSGGDNDLFLLALDVTTGHPLWKIALATLAVDPSHFTSSAAITVDADQLLLCPDVGCAIAVDRWDGSVRWLHPYPSLDQFGEAAGDVGHWGIPPTARFDNHPFVTGTTAYFAPQDALSAFALNSRTGEFLWNSASAYSAMTLIGTADQSAIFQSDRIICLQPGRDGNDEIRWTYNARPESITGPAVINGDVMFVPTTDRGDVPISTVDGREPASPPTIRPPNFRAILNSRSGADLISPQAMATFGFPPAPNHQPQW